MEERTSSTLTEGSIWKRIIFFAIPIFLGNLFQQMYNTADSMLIVGNFLGSNALAAVSSSGNLIQLMIGFFNGIALGAGVVIARYFGARDSEHVEKAVHTTVAFGIVAGIILTIVGVFFAPQILVWMKTPENVMPEPLPFPGLFYGISGLCHVQYVCRHPAGSGRQQTSALLPDSFLCGQWCWISPLSQYLEWA